MSFPNCTQPSHNTYRLGFTKDIEALVGPEKQRFSIHEHVICNRSSFFKAACSERWQQNGTLKAIELPEDDADIFDIYLYCMYGTFVDVGDLNDTLDAEEGLSTLDRTHLRLVKTYMLADKLGDIVTTNMVVDRMIDLTDSAKQLPGNETTRIVTSYTSQESPLRKLFIDYYVHEASMESLRKMLRDDTIPRTFICEVLDEKATLASHCEALKINEVFLNDFTKNHKCRYRQHDKLYPSCCKTCTWEKVE